jgi:hypothetical protein
MNDRSLPSYCCGATMEFNCAFSPTFYAAMPVVATVRPYKVNKPGNFRNAGKSPPDLIKSISLVIFATPVKVVQSPPDLLRSTSPVSFCKALPHCTKTARPYKVNKPW